MEDRFGKTIKVDSWVVFGTRIGNGAETRVGQVTAIDPTAPTVVVRTLRRKLNATTGEKSWELLPISAQPRVANLIVLDGDPTISDSEREKRASNATEPARAGNYSENSTRL